jgi:MFS family permease
MQAEHTVAAPRLRATVPTLPHFSRRAGSWGIAFAFLTVTALSTAPSALYGLYEQHEHFSAITITLVYAVYAAGVTASLLLAGHLSDWYGRKAVLIPALALAVAAAVLFISWQSLTGLLVARVITGLALGATVATATAYITDLDSDPTCPDAAVTRRAGTVGRIAQVGGLATGPLASGLLARYAPAGLTLPYVVLLAALLVAMLAVALTPEGRPAAHPLPTYRPQRPKVPVHARGQFLAAIAGAALAFATWGCLRDWRAGSSRARFTTHPQRSPARRFSSPSAPASSCKPPPPIGRHIAC